MTVPKARKHPVLRRYELRRLKLPVKGGRLSIVCPQSMDALVAAMGEAEFRAAGERMPYWAQVWASSVAVARALRKEPSLAGKRVLDLGCGVGVAGTAAHSAGAEVDFADLAEDALAFARFNAEQNAPAQSPPIRTLRFDWGRDRLPRRYDLIVVADGVYEARDHGPLLELAAHCGAATWFADPGRAPADEFFALLGERFDVRLETHETWFPDRRIPVRIAKVAPRADGTNNPF